MGLTEEQINHIMAKTGCGRSNAGAFDYALSDFNTTNKVEEKKIIAKEVIEKEIKKGGKK